MSRTDRLRRQRALLWDLEGSPEGLTTAELGERLGVSERTALRDLLALRSAGYPLAQAATRWRLVEGQALPSALAADGAGQVAERDKVMVLDASVRARRPLRVGYGSALEPTARLRLGLVPRALRYLDGSLFLVAREHPGGRLLTVAVERLVGIERLEGKASREPRGLLEGYLQESFVRDASRELLRVAVRFERAAAFRVEERVWHPSQRVHRQPDGSVLVTLRVAGFSWVKAWVLGFGAEATVLAPPELTRAVCAELEAARDRYCEVAGRVPQLDLFAPVVRAADRTSPR